MNYYIASGVKNLGSTCYLSCSLQIILRFSPLTNLIHLSKRIKFRESQGSATEKNIFDILDEFSYHFNTEDLPLNPQPLIDFLGIDPKAQTDISEFMSRIINIIFETAPEEAKAQFQDLLLCKLCYNSQIEADPVLFLTIPVSANMLIESSVYEMLQINHQTFTHNPSILFVQINRLTYSKGELLKDSSPMLVSSALDLTPFNGARYILYSAVMHRGGANSGHYNSFIRDSEGWLFANDSLVEEAKSESAALTICSDVKSPAYIIAYVQDESSISVIRKRHSKKVSINFHHFDPKHMTVDKVQIDAPDLAHVPGVVSMLKESVPPNYRITYGGEGDPEFIPSKFERTPIIIVWAQPREYSNITPNQFLSADSITISFKLANTNFVFELDFHPVQTIYDMTQYLDSFYQKVLKASYSTRVKDMYIETKCGLVPIRQNRDLTLFEISLLPFDKISFVYTLAGEQNNPPAQKDLAVLRVVDNRKFKQKVIEKYVNFDDTVGDFLDSLGGSKLLYDVKKYAPLNRKKKLVSVILDNQNVCLEKDFIVGKVEVFEVHQGESVRKMRVQLHPAETIPLLRKRLKTQWDLKFMPEISLVDKDGQEIEVNILNDELPLKVPYTVKCYATE